MRGRLQCYMWMGWIGLELWNNCTKTNNLFNIYELNILHLNVLPKMLRFVTNSTHGFLLLMTASMRLQCLDNALLKEELDDGKFTVHWQLRDTGKRWERL